MNPTTTPLLTADDLLKLKHPGKRVELVKGELRTMPPAGFDHGAIGINLTTPLGSYVHEHGLGIVVAAGTGFNLARNPDTVRAPDLGFVAQDRIPSTGRPRGYWPGAPDLAVEVMSPHDTMGEVEDKVDEWLSAGTRVVWVIDAHDRTVLIYRPGAEPELVNVRQELSGDPELPGFRVPAAQLFN